MNKMLVSAAAGLLLPIANAANPPALKEGLWSVHTVSTDNPGSRKSEGSYRLCRDHAYDLSSQALAKKVKGCTLVNESSQSGKYAIEMHCTSGGSVIESKGTTTFQGDTSAHSESHAKYTPAMAGIGEITMIMDQKYVGSCPAGAKPGDRIDADGRVTHLGIH